MSLIAAKGDIQLQAQAGTMQVAAKNDVTVQSANAHVDWAAAKRIVLSTAGGASITIEGGNVIVACPGTILVRASKKSFVGPENVSYPLPAMPHTDMPVTPPNFRLLLQDMPGPNGYAIAGRPWSLIVLDSSAGDARRAAMQRKHWRDVLADGITTAAGECTLDEAQMRNAMAAVRRMPDHVWLVSGAHATPASLAFVSTGEGDASHRKTLDALNYAPVACMDTDGQKRMFRHWAEGEFGATLGSTPTASTQA